MKIFSAEQIKKWDEYTITNEPIPSIDLMERAAAACCNWLIRKGFGQKHFQIFCGKGNNGGDGLAIARLLLQHNCKATVYILEFDKTGTANFKANQERLQECSTAIHFIKSADFFPTIEKNSIVIDALVGTGINKPLDGIAAALVNHINSFNSPVIAIDMPSGLFADSSSAGNTIIKANHILSFQSYKLAFLLPENESYCSDVHILDIGLHKIFEDEEATVFELTDAALIKTIYRLRKKFAHKGTYGHVALITGSYGMMGAAILSARSCLRSGVGKLTCYIPACGYAILQSAVPEAMCRVTGDEYILSAPGIEKFDAVGIGPGLGLYPAHADLLKEILHAVHQPMLIDADALNIISQHKELLISIPPLSILTPHFKEFERLFDHAGNDFDRLQLVLKKSKEHNIYIVLKGHYTFIGTPEGKGYFNNTGNPGMATAGTGDVLSGIITALLAQGYTPLQSCLLGTHLHGLAGDIAAEKFSQEAMIAGDIVESLGMAFKELAVDR